MLHLVGIIVFIFLFVLIIGAVILLRVVKGFFSIGKKMTGQDFSRERRSQTAGTADYSNAAQKQKTPKKKKVFDDDEGEYVDFEEIKEPYLSIRAEEPPKLQPALQRLFLKKSFTKAAHSSAITPSTTSVLGCKASGAYLLYPLFSSAAPNTSRPVCAQAIAPAHITHGSTVT